MNPMTNVRNIEKLNEEVLRHGVTDEVSWHKQYKDSAWIFIGGLPYDLTEGDILCVFSQYGEIVDINLVKEKNTGKTKGFCFLCYEDQRSTILSVDNLNGIKLGGRTIRVDHCENYRRPKSDEMDESGQKKEIISKGCAPKTPSPSESESSSPSPKRKKARKSKKSNKLKDVYKTKDYKNESSSESEVDERVKYKQPREGKYSKQEKHKGREDIRRENKYSNTKSHRDNEFDSSAIRGNYKNKEMRRGDQRTSRDFEQKDSEQYYGDNSRYNSINKGNSHNEKRDYYSQKSKRDERRDKNYSSKNERQERDRYYPRRDYER